MLSNARVLCRTAFSARETGTQLQTGDMSTDVRNESLAEEFSTLSSSELRHI